MKVEGRNAVLELLKTGKTIDKILIMNGMRDNESRSVLNAIRSNGCKFQFVEKAIMDKETETKRHQGFIAFVSDYVYADFDEMLSKLSEKEDAFLVILDGVEDPHNFGSIIRVAECLGVDGIIISKNRACPINDTVAKVSAGAIEHIKVAKVTNINTEIERLKEKNIWVYACELGGEDLDNADLTGNIAIVMGSEGKGVSSLTRKICDGVVTMKMYGKVNSLNVSVATGIVLYECVRKRRS